jgi:hypothetical protein
MWEEMGQPDYLSRKEVERLQEASLVIREKQEFKYKDGVLSLSTNLPPHAVASIIIEFRSE